METILTQEQDELLKRTRDVLGRLREVLADVNATEADREALSESIRQVDHFFLLVVAGEFNSGKSAFINALIGQSLLQEGVTPTTSQIHVLRHGEEVTREPVDQGTWSHTAPVELLKHINIVDTPGTNAILREHEALTAEFIPRSDLVLFVTSADRPFTESERLFLKQIQEWGKKIVLIINKIDILPEEQDLTKVVEFVRDAGQRLLGDIAAVFPVSARLAKQAKAGQPQLWEQSRFEPLESYIHNTLDDEGRFRLKLLNPLGVGKRLVNRYLSVTEDNLALLQDDATLLDDIQRQTTYYNEDMQRNFKARLGEIDNILFEMEKRGNEYFDETIRFGRIPDLIRTKHIQHEFEQEVVADTPRQLENRIGELVDWMVEQDLRQWTSVAEHLSRRREDHAGRIVGQSGPREGTLAYDRQRLIDSIGHATKKAIESFDKEREAEEIAEAARNAVVNTGLAGVGVGLGVAIAAAVQLVWVDVTGILAAVGAATLGLLILPARRRSAKQELGQKLADLRQKLMSNLTEQFEREMRRSAQRVEDTVAPFARFVRAEQEKLEAERDELVELEAHITGLRRQLDLPEE
ncbi:MAG TPA: dynamin family protein [Candidatus Sulfomarinibacteraceae bacterium]|nr:dynamin family protein [Candidatus Sulfomarinibacteraceae bacterium]